MTSLRPDVVKRMCVCMYVCMYVCRGGWLGVCERVFMNLCLCMCVYVVCATERARDKIKVSRLLT